MRDFIATIWTKFAKESIQEENGKLTEKAFIRRIAVGVISIIFCLSAMGISAYAFFTSSITSSKNTLTSATYEIDIDAKNSSGTALTQKDGTTDVYELAIDTYTVTLTAEGTAKNGYCKVEILEEAQDGTRVVIDTYYTKPLAPGGSITFTVECKRDVEMQFTSNWGSYAGYVDDLPAMGSNCLYKETVWSNGFVVEALISTHSETNEEEEEQASEQAEEQAQQQMPDESEQQEQAEQQQQEQPTAEQGENTETEQEPSATTE